MALGRYWRSDRNWKLTFSEILACFQVDTKLYSRDHFLITA
jgi:hypothetical protein